MGDARGGGALRIRPALSGATLLALGALAFGCQDPFRYIEAASVQGRLAADLLPADREVGSWRRAGKEGASRRLWSRDFRRSLGDEAFARAKPWEPNEGASAVYRLGETGRTVTVEIYDLAKAKGAFDVYSLIREKALAAPPASPSPAMFNWPDDEKKALEEPIPLRVTKAGVQGLLYPSTWESRTPGGSDVISSMSLLFWAERYLVRATALGGTGGEPEAALLAFAAAITTKLEQPFELPEVYALQIPGEAANSERYDRGRLFGRRELAGAVTAKWAGKSGSGTLFISVAESSPEAAARFERFRRACKGELTPNFAEGLFTGELPGAGPVIGFRHGKALAGLLGAVERGEGLAAVEEIRRRCAGEPAAPAGRTEVGKP